MLELIREGKTNPEIAEALFLSRNTVSTYVTRLFDKTGARTRANLVAIAYREGL